MKQNAYLCQRFGNTGCSAVRLAHLLWEQGVEGSNPFTPTQNRVGGKRSSFLPTFVFRPLTPPRMRFRTWRFFIWDTI